MVTSLYTRLLVFQGLLLVVGGVCFWLFAVKLSIPEPMSFILAGGLCLVAASVVTGLLLTPVDQLHLAIRHLAHGEQVPMPEVKAPELRPLVGALEALQTRLNAAPKAPTAPAAVPAAGGATAAELLGVLNGLSEGIAIVDRDLHIVLLNTAMRTMAGLENYTGGTGLLDGGLERYNAAFHKRCFVPDQLALIEDEVRKAPDRPRTDIVQLENPNQFLKRYSAPLYNERHEHTGFLVSYTDITHEVEMDRMRQEFIANASHELRTPVTSVKVLLENLVEGAKDDPAVRDEFINDAAMEIDRMHDLVNDLLDLAALESGRNQLQLTSFEINKVVQEAVATVAPQAKHRDVSLESDMPEDGVCMQADKGRMRQVLVNLVANAVKFTPNGGRVQVKAHQENGQVRFTICDTGIGIPDKDLSHIFDRFFRVTRGRSRLQGGSGLGLTIVKQAIDAHRGEITVESTEGQGTTFTIVMPTTQAEA